MHVGVDARLLLGALTGIGRYTFELSKRLAHIPGSTFSFYTPSPIAMEIMQAIGEGDFRAASSFRRLSKMVWSQTKLPHWANRGGINLFWGPTHRLPRHLSQSIARVVTIHDLVWKFAPQTMRPLSLFLEKRLMPEAIASADLVMADSQSTASGIAEVFPQFAHKVRVVHLGVSRLGTPDRSALIQLHIHKPYFLFVGTLEPRKNLERLLYAYSMIPALIRSQFSLVIAGGIGWGGVDLEKMIRSYQLQGSVQLLGYVTDHQLAALYSNARFLAMPSLYEGFGLPLLEAMQYGTPVLTSSVGALAEVAGNGGLLVDSYSEKSISDGIYQMLSNDHLKTELGNNAKRRSQEFSWDKCAAETMAVFEEAIATRNARISKV